MKIKYSREEVSCCYCTEYHHKNCPHRVCPWLEERIEAGTASYSEVLSGFFQEYRSLSVRIWKAHTIMRKTIWRDSAHCCRFEHAQAVHGYRRRRNTNEYYAALFLLTAEEDLYKRAQGAFTNNLIDFRQIKLRGISETGYKLYQSAKCLYRKTNELNLSDLADEALFNNDEFKLVINAILINSYGLAITQLSRR